MFIVSIVSSVYSSEFSLYIGHLLKKVIAAQHQIEKRADTAGNFDYLFLSESVVVFLLPA